MTFNIKSLISVVEEIDDEQFTKDAVIHAFIKFYDTNKKEINKLNQKFKNINNPKDLNKDTKKLSNYNLFVFMCLNEDEEVKILETQRERLKLISEKWNKFKINGIPDKWYEQNIHKHTKY